MGRRERQGRAWEHLVRDEFAPRLAAYQRRAEAGGVLAPQAVYGYFPAAGLGDDVIVYDPLDPRREIARFPFTRQIGGEHLCLADYLREPVDGGASDVIALQVVTMGARRLARDRRRASARTITASPTSFTASRYKRPKRWPKRCTNASGANSAPSGRGKRYCWGYGACPGPLAAHDRLAAARRRLRDRRRADRGIPDRARQSTAAIVMHHPQATYFNAGAVRELIAV